MIEAASDISVVVLAAGLGTRMKSDKAKVLHEIAGRPMIAYVVDTASAVAGNNVVLVVGHQAQVVRDTVARQADLHYALQDEQLGTGHAVMCAMSALPVATRHVVVLCGDVPLLREKTLRRFVHDHRSQQRTLSILAVRLSDPRGYGRVVQDQGGHVTGIIEEADATASEKTINLVNTGIYCIEKTFLESALQRIRSDNAQGEYYLTDIVALAHQGHHAIGVTIGTDADEFLGVNSPEQLKAVERLLAKTRA